MSDYPKQINAILKALNTNQTGLSKILGVSRGIISEFTSGSREPSKEFMFGLSKLGISLDWFLTGEGEIFLPGKDPRHGVKRDTVSHLSSTAPEGEESQKLEPGSHLSDEKPSSESASSESTKLDPPKRIRQISLDLQGIADELDAGGPVPARLRPLVSRVARLDDEDLAKTTAYVDDLLQKVKYAQGEESIDQEGANVGTA